MLKFNPEFADSCYAGLPLIEIYYQGTGSRAAASVLMALFASCFFGCLTGNATTASRTLWAVSRDNALPYSSLWMRVSHRFKMPLNAMCLSGTVVSVSWLFRKLLNNLTFSSSMDSFFSAPLLLFLPWSLQPLSSCRLHV
jgi:choline transport protein